MQKSDRPTPLRWIHRLSTPTGARTSRIALPTAAARLGRTIMVRPQSLGEVAASLIERGLVERDGPGGRGHRAALRITEVGRALLGRALPGVMAFNASRATGLSDADAAELVRMLRTVRATLSSGGGPESG